MGALPVNQKVQDTDRLHVGTVRISFQILYAKGDTVGNLSSDVDANFLTMHYKVLPSNHCKISVVTVKPKHRGFQVCLSRDH